MRPLENVEDCWPDWAGLVPLGWPGAPGLAWCPWAGLVPLPPRSWPIKGEIHCLNEMQPLVWLIWFRMIEPMQPANLNQQLEKHQSASDSFFLFLPLPSEEELGGVGSLRFKLDATGLGKDVPSTFAIATWESLAEVSGAMLAGIGPDW